MGFYALKRLGGVAASLLVMSVLVFLATHALPANTAALILGPYATPATQIALEHKLGLDQPLLLQYWIWASGILHGNLGQSLVMERPIAPVLFDAIGKSAVLAVMAMTIVSIFGITLGVAGAIWRGRWPDHAIAVFTYSGLAVPEFYWGLVLILVVCSTFHLLPSSGAATLSDGFGNFLAHLVLPVLTLSLSFLAHVSRLVRSSMLETLQEPYVKAARARGLPEHIVILRHAVRNALLPAITVLAQDFGSMIGGVVTVETIFAYPGVGRLLIFSLQRLDLPMMEAAILVITAIYGVANLIADLLYALLNPRIRYGAGVA